MSCAGCIEIKLLLGLHTALCCLFCIMLMALELSRIRRVLTLFDRQDGRRTRGRGIELAFTGSSLARPPQHCAIWGLPARGAARQRLQRIAVFPTRPAGAERAQAHVPLRKSRRLGFRARGAASHPRRRACGAGDPRRARLPVASRLHAIDAREPATSAKLGPRRLKQRGG